MSPHGIAGTQDRSSPNSGNKCRLARPQTLPNFIALGQTMYEKSVTNFLHPSVIWRPMGPPGQYSPILVLMYSKAPSINLPNSVPFWSTRYLLPNLISSISLTTWPTKNSKRHVSAYCATTTRGHKFWRKAASLWDSLWGNLMWHANVSAADKGIILHYKSSIYFH